MQKKALKSEQLPNSEASELERKPLPSLASDLGSFPARLKEVIGGQSVRSFAAACNLSDGVVRQYIAGKSEPGLEALIKIAHIGNVNVNWLATGEGSKNKDSYDIMITNARKNRGKQNTLSKKWQFALECFKCIGIHNIINGFSRSELMVIINNYNSNNNLSVTYDEAVEWCNEVWTYSENLHNWYNNNYYPFRRGEINIDHPFTWLVKLTNDIADHNDIDSLGPLYLDDKNFALADDYTLPENYIRVPHYNIAASAGGGATVHSEQIVDYLAFKADWLKISLGLSPSNAAVISVMGDSMEPFLANGDLVLIDMGVERIEDDSVYVLVSGDSLKIKRIQKKMDGTVIVKSDNERYEPEVYRGDAAKHLRVVGRLVRRLVR